MTINLQPLSPEKTILRIIGSGVTYPFSFSETGRVKSVAISQGLRKLNQSIHNILATRRGERMMLPEYGCFAGDTKILTLTGQEVPISSLVGVNVETFGVSESPATSHEPKSLYLNPSVSKIGAVSQGVRPTVRVTLSNGREIVCTSNHLFMRSDGSYVAADESDGASLAWVDPSLPNLNTRVWAWKMTRSLTKLAKMPLTADQLFVVSVVEDVEQEVFDIVGTSTNNYTLGAGPVVHNSNLHKLVFEPIDGILADALEFETADALRRWEGRIELTQVRAFDPQNMDLGELRDVGGNVDSLKPLLDKNWIGIYIEYIVRQYHTKGTYVYPFETQAMPISDTITGNNSAFGRR